MAGAKSFNEKLKGMYPEQDDTPSKILKKLGFRNGRNSQGRVFEHGAIQDKHKDPSAKKIMHNQGTKVAPGEKKKMKESLGTAGCALDKASMEGMSRKLLYER